MNDRHNLSSSDIFWRSLDAEWLGGGGGGGGGLNTKMPSYQHRNSHYDEMTV